jgi:hypothetical protein
VQRQCANRKKHHEHFQDFRADGNVSLAVAVCEPAAGHRKQDERQRKQRAHHQHQEIALLFRQVHSHDDINHQEFDGVVVKRALELGDDQAPKTE